MRRTFKKNQLLFTELLDTSKTREGLKMVLAIVETTNQAKHLKKQSCMLGAMARAPDVRNYVSLICVPPSNPVHSLLN